MPELDVIAGAGLHIETDDAAEERARRADRDRRWPRIQTIPGSYAGAAAQPTYGYMPFQGPTQGRLWEVVTLRVSGPDPFTTIANCNMAAFVGSEVPQDASAEPPLFPELILMPGQVPNTAFFGRHVVQLRSTERVIVVFKGLPNNQQIQAWLGIIDHDYEQYLKIVGAVD